MENQLLQNKISETVSDLSHFKISVNDILSKVQAAQESVELLGIHEAEDIQETIRDLKSIATRGLDSLSRIIDELSSGHSASGVVIPDLEEMMQKMLSEEE